MLPLLLTFLDDKNNENDFIELYETYNNYIYKLCFDLVHDHYLAEDCLQETFIIVAKNFRKIKNAESQKAKNLVITIAKCVSIKAYNKSVRNDEVFFNDIDKVLLFRTSAEDELFDNYSVQELYDAIESLNDSLKLPLILKDFYNFRQKDVADIFGISIYAVRQRLMRARNEIKKYLEKDID